MNSIPYVPTSGDWAIIVAGIIIFGSLIGVAATFLVARLIRFVGGKAFIGWVVIMAVILLAALTVFGN